MNSLTANLRAIGPAAALRVLLLFVLAAAGTTLWAQQRIASASVTINVLEGLTATLKADPLTIKSGGSSTLTWTTTGASSASISPNPGGDPLTGMRLASGTQAVSPSATTTYTLTASDGDDDTDDVTATATVTVLVIDSFAADDRSPDTGESVILSWTTSGADRVELQQGASGNFSVVSGASTSPDGSYTRTENTAVSRNFRLVAYAGTLSLTSSTVGVTWRAPDSDPDPVIDRFTANPSSITVGGSSRLEWETTHADSVSIPGTTGTLLVDGNTSVSPTVDTDYELTASGASGTDDDTEIVTVKVTPKIDSFSANPTTITVGDQATLSWTTQGATSASINQNVGTVSVGANQSTSVSPDTDTTYTLTASDAEDDTATEPATVKVKPKIVSFSASSTTITKGDPVTLRWTTEGATSASINQDVGTVSVGTNQSTSVSPSATTTYTLTASDAENDTATATSTVTVVDSPVIGSFSAKPSTITEGGSSTLTWTTTGATSVSIPGTTGTLLVNGSTSVSPDTSTTYTLTAKNNADTPASATSSVAITVNRLPPTASLSADPEEVFNPGDAATLTWSTTRATSAEIDNGVGSVTPVADGDTTVYPDTTTTYTLTATGPGGSSTDTATVYTVDFQRTLAATLTADATTITRGGSTMLRWTTEGADRASLSQDVGDDIGSVAATELASGSRSVSPTATTKYTITATKGEGDDAVSATAAVTITVTQP